MQEILMRAGSFILIILLGFMLRKVGVFKKEDFRVLSTVVLKITLPTAIVVSFNGRNIDPSLLSLSGLGFIFGVLYLGLAWVLGKRKGKENQAFDMLNLSGYNIGNFTMPFAQSFLGPIGVITTSLFDAGNAIICLGGAYSISAMIKGGSGFSVRAIGKTLIRSIAFDAYVVMTCLSLLHITLPRPVSEFAGIIANGNAFLAMLMLGVGFHISGSKSQKLLIVRHLAIRYGVAAIVASICYFLLPLDLEYRQALVILVFSPIASAAPAFTAQMNGDEGKASAINSISILISIVCIMALLAIML